jgi:hypothetical protein
MRTTTRPCTLCGAWPNPNVHRRELHHVWPKGLGGPENGLQTPLCPNHHDLVHEFIDVLIDNQGVIHTHKFSNSVRALAMRGYLSWKAGKLVGS